MSVNSVSGNTTLGTMNRSHRLRLALPTGRALPDEVWRQRHQAILALVWLHVVGLVVFGLFTDHSLGHSLSEAAWVGVAALIATFKQGNRRVGAMAASVGLILSSGMLVHFSGGYIEMHFHFFVMVVVIALYQDWSAFLIALGYVVLHHGVVGTLDPYSVYNHPDAWADPWTWSLIHGLFIGGVSLASVAHWHFNETVRAHTESILDAVDDGIIGLDQSGRVVFVNPAATALLGYRAEEFIGRLNPLSPRSEFNARAEAQKNESSRWLAANHEEGLRTIEQLFWRKDGSSFLGEYVCTPFQNRGADAGTVTVFRDITERKQVESALRESESHLRALMESMPQIVWVTRPDGWHTHFNQQWLDYTGLTLEESLGHGWNPPFHPDDRPRAAKRWQQATESGEAYEIEYRLRRADGIYHWMLGRALPLRDETGAIVKWFGTCTDIHALKEAEEALRVSQERFHSIFEYAAIGLALVSLDGEWLEVNPALCEITGYSEEELLRLSFQDITHPDDLERDMAYVRQLLAGEIRSYQLEKRYLHKQGHVIWILLSGSLVHDETGAPHSFIAQIQDISERIQAEEALRQLSVRDPLTGLYNRRYLDAALEREEHRALRQGMSIGVMMLDIDHFKQFNDSWGHRTGDALLRALGTVLQGLVRGEDIPCRYGGEEFCLVLPGVGRERLRERAELIRAAVNRISLPENVRSNAVTCSVGIAVFPEDGATIAAVTDAADQALYAAKRAGRNQVVLA